jgi:hypothetical protein
MARVHEHADLLQRTVTAQAHLQCTSKRITPSAQPDVGRVLQTFPIPLHKPSLPLSPNVEFHDLPRMSDSPVEQEMLDHSTLSGEDLDIMTFGSDLPNLSPNFHSPEALLAAVDHFTAYNEGTLSGVRPLTAYEAHRRLPVHPEECTMQREVTRLFR